MFWNFLLHDNDCSIANAGRGRCAVAQGGPPRAYSIFKTIPGRGSESSRKLRVRERRVSSPILVRSSFVPFSAVLVSATVAMAENRNIPIKMGDFSVIDSEFVGIRERFDAEMRKMEEEMSKFRSELMSREANNFFKSTTSSTTTQTSHNTSSDLTRPSEVRTWLDDLNSPLIQGDGDAKCLKLRFDVSQYAPEEIVVKTVDNKLLVHAKHEEKTDTKSVYREYNREFLLPKGTNPESIKSSLSKDGVLTVEAPLPAITHGETLIPIQH